MIELTDRRTLRTKLFQLGPGQFRQEVSAAPVHWYDGSQFQDIDLTWDPGSGTRWKVKSVGFQCDFDPVTCILRYNSRTTGDITLRLVTINGVAPLSVAPSFSPDGTALRVQSLGAGVNLQINARPQGPEIYRFLDGPTIPVLVWSVDESQALGAIQTNLLSIEGVDNRLLAAPSRTGEVLSRNQRRFVEMQIVKSAETVNAGRRTYTVTEQMTGRTRWRDPVTRAPEWRVGELEWPVLLDVQVIEDIATGLDDGHSYTGSAQWFGSTGGQPAYMSTLYAPAWRFQTVNVPQAATITSATLRFDVFLASANAAGTLYGQNVDDAPSWTHGSANGPVQMAKTTANAAFPSLTTTGQKTITVTAIVQEIVNRAGFAANNSIRLGAGSASGAAVAKLYTVEYLGGGSLGRLTIDYTSGVSSAPSIFCYPGET